MSINEKVSHIREIITLVCEVLPQIISLMKEVIVAIKEVQTVQKGDIMANRHPLSQNISNRLFKRNAVKTKRLNSEPPIMRGGIRL